MFDNLINNSSIIDRQQVASTFSLLSQPNNTMKRFTLVSIFAAFLISTGFQPVFGQNFEAPMKKISEDSTKKVIGLDLSESEKFAKNSDEVTDGLKRHLRENDQQLSQLYSQSRQMKVVGLQDESGVYISGLGQGRAENVAQFINGEILMRGGLSLVGAEGLALGNDDKTRMLNDIQKYLNDRSVLIVAYKKHDTAALWGAINDLQSMPWWFLPLIGLLLFLTIASIVSNWTSDQQALSSRNSGNSGNAEDTDNGGAESGSTSSGENDDPVEIESEEENGDVPSIFILPLGRSRDSEQSGGHPQINVYNYEGDHLGDNYS